MIFGNTVHFFKSLNSTQIFLEELTAKTKPSNGTAVVSDFQTAGRGQFGREWQSSPGKNLLMSFVFYPKELPPSHLGLLHFFVSIALIRTLQHFGVNYARIKWPNDIVIENEKLAGIIVKNILSKGFVSQSIVGMGINVNQSTFELDTKYTPISLGAILGHSMERSEVMNTLFDQLNELVAYFNDPSHLKRAYLNDLKDWNQEIIFRRDEDDEQMSGIVRDVLLDGKIVIEVNGRMKSFSSGEIKI